VPRGLGNVSLRQRREVRAQLRVVGGVGAFDEFLNLEGIQNSR
jgi:hypothetical protein